jgi:Carboxypeptidase regulatory-like domain
MKKQLGGKLAVILATVVLFGLGALTLNQKVSAAAGGSIAGTVKLSGTAPHMKGIDMSKDPYCSKLHESNPAHLENILVGQDNGLQNVVLYISQGLTGNEANAVPSEQPTFDQKGCMYSPHVLAMDAEQKFQVISSDQTTHNIHPLPDALKGNIPWNKSQPPGAPPIVTSWKNVEVPIPVKCNIHPWMHGYFVVVKGPYATTDNNGSYTIQNVPAGSYTVTAWQEDLGTQTANVTVAAGGPAKADFTFKAK